MRTNHEFDRPITHDDRLALCQARRAQRVEGPGHCEVLFHYEQNCDQCARRSYRPHVTAGRTFCRNCCPACGRAVLGARVGFVRNQIGRGKYDAGLAPTAEDEHQWRSLQMHIYVCESATSKWSNCLYASAEPSPHDFAGDGLHKHVLKRLLRLRREELNTTVASMEVNLSELVLTTGSSRQIWGVDGTRTYRTEVELEFADLGQCLLGRTLFNGWLKSILVVVPTGRLHITDDNIPLRIAARVPDLIAETLSSKIKADGLNPRETTAFVIRPRKRRGAEPRGLRDYELLMIRAALRWAKKRDRARRRSVIVQFEPRPAERATRI